jgi:hypothetical protein
VSEDDANFDRMPAVFQAITRAHRRVFESRRLARFSNREKVTLQEVIGFLDYFAQEASKKLQECKWTAAELLGDSRELRSAWDQLSKRRQGLGSQNMFNRFRSNRLTVEYCQAAQVAILNGSLVEAIGLVISGTNASLADKAIIAKARETNLQAGRSTPARQNQHRDQVILQTYESVKAANPSVSKALFAETHAGRTIEGFVLPGVAGIRKILSRGKS